MLDVNNPVVALCTQGARAELEHRREEACDLYRQAWNVASDDYERCIAAHYMARCQSSPAQILAWNRTALDHANAVADDRVEYFFPSLHVNLGHAHERMGQLDEAQRLYDLAAATGVIPARKINAKGAGNLESVINAATGVIPARKINE